MATVNKRMTHAARHCSYCGHAVPDETPATERFGKRFCSESHAEEFVAGVRAVRIQGAARDDMLATACAPAPAGQRTWKDYLKQGACWGTPLLLLLAIPLFWTGSAWGATGGSLLSVLALLACPLGMYLMMRAMGRASHGAASAVRRRRE